MDQIDPKVMEKMIRDSQRQSAIFDTLPEELPFLTRVVMANDMRQAEDALAAARAGEIDAKRALVYSGSYSRMQTLVSLVEEDLLSLDDALDLLPETWPISDPDDTDPAYVDLWQQAFDRKGGLVTDEGKSLPKRGTLTIYRGQRKGDKIGCAWSLSETIAEKFMRGASYRTAVPDGIMLQADVPKGMILAYLTGRGEEEVILDPTPLSIKETK